ncbi:MAG TPA: Rieske 2Fe-2S domain-containing protein [Chloroflexota bacterium]|nr:Rieske 2Fe-2S domain-containing protein [Chloroflexota bacterium]
MTVPVNDYTDFAHTGPGTLAGRYMRMFWHPIYMARDLKPGRAVPIRIMSEDFTLYRGEGGKPHLVDFRCAHRGTQLSTGWVEGDCIRCFYHGWKYDETGQCVEQPAEDEAFARKVRINSYPVQEYLGLIFAYLGEGLPPELPHYPDFEDEGVLTPSTYVRDCNWFQNLENVVDEVHVAFTHRVSEFGNHGLYVVPEVSAEASEWGVTMYAKRPGESCADGEQVRVTQLGMPNIANVAGSPNTDEGGWEDFIAWRVPIDDTVHRSFNVHMAHVKGEAAERYKEEAAKRRASRPKDSYIPLAQQVMRGELAWPDVEHRPDIVGIQDYVSQVGQGVFADRENEHLGKSDVGIIILRRLWTRELRALAESQPLTQWTRPKHLTPAPGAV